MKFFIFFRDVLWAGLRAGTGTHSNHYQLLSPALDPLAVLHLDNQPYMTSFPKNKT